MSSSQVYVQRNPSAGNMMSPLNSGIISNAAGNVPGYAINRQMAQMVDSNPKPPRQSNAANQNAFSRKIAAQDNIHFDDDRSEYSCMSMPQLSNFGGQSQSLPFVNYRVGTQTSDRK